LEQSSGFVTFTKHPRRQSKSIALNVDWRSRNKVYGDIRLIITLGPFVFSPHAITGSRMRKNLYLTFTNTLIPPLWPKMVGNYIALGQAARVEKASYDRIESYVRACANTKAVMSLVRLLHWIGSVTPKFKA
jgi:hypothetical protein